jgi:hypothetical protein
VTALMAIVSVGLLTGCSGGSDAGDGRTGPSSSAPERREPTASPQEYLQATFDELDPVARLDQALSLSYLARRFGEVEEMEWAEELVERSTEEVADDPDLSIFGRFLASGVDPPSTIEGSVLGQGSQVDTDQMVSRSLWCDRLELPTGFVADLDTAAQQGGYELTHAFGAAQLIVENGCATDDAAGLRDRLAPAVASLLDSGAAGDLEVQACALLHWAGHPESVPDSYREVVVDARLPDGSWPQGADGEAGDPHTTVWALRCQLEIEHRELPPTRWVADPPD